MKIFIDSNPSEIKAVSVNSGLNFGRFYDFPNLPFELHLSKTEFLNLAEAAYNKVRLEIKADDEMYSDSSAFKEVNYCSLENLLQNNEKFEEIVKTYLDMAIYFQLFHAPLSIQFIINSTESILIENEMVVFEGRVFEVR